MSSNTYANYRRAAVSSQPKVQADPSDPRTGSKERQALLSVLSSKEKLVLRELAAKASFLEAPETTEAEEYLLFQCRLAGGARDRAPLEADVAPKLIVERIIRASAASPTQGFFYVPVRAIRRPEWRKTLPAFDGFIVSTTRFPVWSDTADRLLPGFDVGVKMIKLPSAIDAVEVYFGAVAGSLGEYWRNPSEALARNIWALLWSLQGLMDDGKSSASLGTDVGAKSDRLASLIENRDSSRESADAFRKFLQDLPPAHYYALLYRIMVERPELVHRSRFGSLDAFLLGLLTQHRLPADEAITLAGAEDHFLRMVMERAMKKAKRRDLKDFTDRDSLVRYLHESAGKEVEAELRYWTFMVEVGRSLLLAAGNKTDVTSFTTPREFAARLRTVHQNVSTMGGGLTPFCLRISRDTERYLTDAALAEFLLQASECSGDERKFTVLLTSMFVSHSQATLRIDEVLRENTERAAAFQARLAAIKAEQAEQEAAQREEEKRAAAAANESLHLALLALKDPSSQLPEEERRKLWEAFRAKHQTHLHDSGVSVAFCTELMAYALDGTERSLHCILALLQGAASTGNTPVLGFVQARKLMVRVAKPGSAVYAHFAAMYRPHDLRLTQEQWPKAGITGVLLHDASRDLTRALPARRRPAPPAKKSAAAEEVFEEVVAPIEFVKFELVRERVRRDMAALAVALEAVTTECFICFEERAPKSMVTLHGDTRHVVCTQCRPALKACPFCRAQL